MTTGLIHHPIYEKHDTGFGHPETPERYRVVIDAIKGDAKLGKSLIEITPEKACSSIEVFSIFVSWACSIGISSQPHNVRAAALKCSLACGSIYLYFGFCALRAQKPKYKRRLKCRAPRAPALP